MGSFGKNCGNVYFFLHFPQDMDAALAEIERTLHMARAAPQKTPERLQNKIDRIADGLESN